MRPRLLLVASLLLVITACRLPSLASRAKALGAKTEVMMRPLVTPARVDVDLQAVALRTKARQRVAAPEPVVVDQRVRPARPAPSRARPAPAPVTMTTQRTTVARPAVFLLTGVTYGGKEICEEFRSIDVCTRSCLDYQRSPTPVEARGPNEVKHCACGDYDRGC